MSTLEDKRLLCEELEAIDWAITQRIKRVPQLHPNISSNNGILTANKNKSTGQVLALQHEVLRLLQRHDEVVATLQNIDLNLNDFKDPDFNFDKFDSLYKEVLDKNKKNLIQGNNDDDILNLYKMFGSGGESKSATTTTTTGGNNKKRKVTKSKKRIFSLYAQDLKLSSIFNKFEKMGKFLDLDDLFKKWLSLPKVSQDLSFDDLPNFLQFLDFFNEFDKQSIYIKRDNIDYLNYLKNLLNYLQQFYIKIHPLENPQITINKIQIDSQSKIDKSSNSTDLIDKVEEDGSVYCSICEKKFAKETVYKSHLMGKKHLKNIDKKKTKNNDTEKLIKSINLLEDEIYEISKLLDNQIKSTKNEIERKKLLTQRERLLEQQDESDITDNEYDFESDNNNDGNGGNNDDDNDINDDDDDDDEGNVYNPLNLPIGPDGKPIPYWLYKIQGLRTEYKCEICGGQIYQGRKKFDLHFNNETHLHGLKCLGIESDKFQFFKDIYNINEALSLWDVMKKQQREDLKFKDNSVEIEDEDGNVMSEKIYNQLRKQGIL